MHAYARPRKQSSQANTSEASRQAVVQSHTAALSYLAESADIASEYSIWLCFAVRSFQFAAHPTCVFSRLMSAADLFPVVDRTYQSSIGHIMTNC